MRVISFDERCATYNMQIVILARKREKDRGEKLS